MSHGDGEEESRRGGGGGEDEQQSARRVRRRRHPLALPFIKSSGKRGSRIPPPPPRRPSVDDLGKGCYPCFLRPPASPNPASVRSPGGPSGSRPPNYYEFLKSMIEQNDFYSPECNIHRDGP